MAQSEVDCCNSALARVGAASIIALDSSTNEGRKCLVAYESNRKSELRKHNWNFSIKRVTLAPDTAAPTFDFTYQFTIPEDCLKILRPADYYLDWVIEGRKILSNTSNVLNLRYVADVPDVTQWDAVFYDMVSVSLAMDICEPLTNSVSKKSALAQDYKDAAAEARKANAFEQGQADPADDGFLVAHRTSGRAGWPANWVNFKIQA